MFRLARMLGKTVYELKNLMSIKELNGWAQYLSREPHNSIEIQTALVAMVAANAMGGKSKLEDMLITQYKIEQTAEQLVSERPQDKDVLLAFQAFG